jgi:hypothetical protein
VPSSDNAQDGGSEMEQQDIRGWADHRLAMATECIRSFVILIVGVGVVDAVRDLDGSAAVMLSIVTGLVAFMLWFASMGAISDIAVLRNDMNDSLRASAFGGAWLKAPFPVIMGLITITMLGSAAAEIVMVNT